MLLLITPSSGCTTQALRALLPVVCRRPGVKRPCTSALVPLAWLGPESAAAAANPRETLMHGLISVVKINEPFYCTTISFPSPCTQSSTIEEGPDTGSPPTNAAAAGASASDEGIGGRGPTAAAIILSSQAACWWLGLCTRWQGASRGARCASSNITIGFQ